MALSGVNDLSTITRTVRLPRDLFYRCHDELKGYGRTFDELVGALLRDVLESDDLQEILTKRPTEIIKNASGTRVREDLVLKLAPFSKLHGVAFGTDALREYRLEWSGLTRSQLAREVERLAGRGAFKKRIGDKTAHIVPLTADRTTPAQALTYLHYVRAALNGGEGVFVLSRDRDVYNDATGLKSPPTPAQKPEPAPQPIVYESLPTITYEAPSVLSYGDE